MGHAKLNLQRMYDWIYARAGVSEPMPDDAEICDHFGFTSTEQARTLLAELADAGRITIKGYGETRTITLGRTRTSLAPAARVEPAVGRSDPQVDRAAARIAEIVNRGRKPAAAVVAENAAKLLSTVTRPPARAPAKAEEPAVPAKTIQLPAASTAAIAAVEHLAKESGISLGQAAADLIGRGVQVAEPAAPAFSVVALPDITTIVADLHRLFDSLVDRADAAEQRPDQSAAIKALTQRAEGAERKLAALRAAMAD